VKRISEWVVVLMALLFVAYTTVLFISARRALHQVETNSGRLQLLNELQLNLDTLRDDITQINSDASEILTSKLAQQCKSDTQICALNNKWLLLRKNPSTPAIQFLQRHSNQTTIEIRSHSRNLSIELNTKWHQLIFIAFSGCAFALVSSILLIILRRRRLKTEKQNAYLVKMSQELEQSNLKLREAGKEREAFSHLVSHEMKTPLNIISGLADMMVSETDPIKKKNFAEEIRIATNGLARIIDNTIDYDKYYRGEIEISKSPFSLHALCGLVYRSIALAAEKKPLKIDMFIDPSVHDHFIGDGVFLSRILMQLMSNAVKFTEKGNIELSVGLISESRTSQVLEFKVSDSGKGMDKKREREILDAFNQKSSTFSRSTEGIGLGLSMAEALLQALGTRLKWHSVSNIGSQFYFSLELDKIDNQIINEQQLEELKEKRVLIVEDNRLNLLILKRYLEKSHLLIDTALTHEEAIGKLSASTYDCILLDLQIPGKDGFEIMQEVRQMQPDYKTPVLAVTAASIQFVHEKIKAHGFYGFVAKPIREQEILAKIFNAIKDSQK
jgi:signal transduction histidine kinase/ActR/RegA family two-component response regulator